MKCNLLIAYPYLTPACAKLLAEIKDARIFIDSGAFTAWKAGTKIKLQEYISFIKNLPFKPDGYFMLDEIGDPEGTKRNYKIMLDAGLNPIPIFTRGEKLSVMDEYFDTADVVGIGGLVQTRGNKGFVKGIMNKVGSRKVHWLGFTNTSFIAHFNPYSCDSSSWASSIWYGQLSLFSDSLTEIIINKKTFMEVPSREIFDLFKLYGEDINKLRSKSEWVNSGRGKSCLERMAFKSIARRIIDTERLHKTMLFAAICCDGHIDSMNEAFMYWRNK